MKNLWLIFLLLLPISAAAQEGGHWEGPPSVALYTSKSLQLSAEQLQALAPESQVTELQSDNVPRYSVKWDDVEVIVFAGYNGDFQQHLQGMRGFVYAMAEDRPQERDRAMERIETFKASVGTQILPTFDQGGKAKKFVMSLARVLDATLFTAASLYNTDGSPLLFNGGPKKL